MQLAGVEFDQEIDIVKLYTTLTTQSSPAQYSVQCRREASAGLSDICFYCYDQKDVQKYIPRCSSVGGHTE